MSQGQMGVGIAGIIKEKIAAGKGLSELNEGRKLAMERLDSWRGTDFNAGGLQGRYSGNTFSLTRSEEFGKELRGMDSAFRQTGLDFRDAAERVAPGMGELTQSRVLANENNRRRAIGNLRDNLQRRRVLGSSFAQDAQTRSEMEYTQEEDRIRAESFMQELQMNTELLAKANEAEVQRAGMWINQQNFESGMAANLTNQVNTITGANAQIGAQLTAEIYAARAGIYANMQAQGADMINASAGSIVGGGMPSSPPTGGA